MVPDSEALCSRSERFRDEQPAVLRRLDGWLSEFASSRSPSSSRPALCAEQGAGHASRALAACSNRQLSTSSAATAGSSGAWASPPAVSAEAFCRRESRMNGSASAEIAPPRRYRPVPQTSAERPSTGGRRRRRSSRASNRRRGSSRAAVTESVRSDRPAGSASRPRTQAPRPRSARPRPRSAPRRRSRSR